MTTATGDFQLDSVIPVLGEAAYRNVRAKLQHALQALAVGETERALTVAEFSVLYRALPVGHQINLTLGGKGQQLTLTLLCEADASLVDHLDQQLHGFESDRIAVDESASTALRLRRCFRMGPACEPAQAEEWLLGSTAEELKLKAAQTEEANTAKREFLSRMSHELRTPMNAIIGMTHLALRTNLDKKQRDYIDKIRLAGENLLGIINDILDFSKIEAGKLSIERTEFQLDQVLGDVANLVADRVFTKGVELLFSVDEEVPDCLNGDPLRLTQILLNLLSNATKFTEQGQITLRVSLLQRHADDVELEFQVQDTGIGMSETQIANLFQAFSQADVSTTRRYGGTGLGLSICQRLLELMGGGITVTSQPGEGSCFHARARFGIGRRRGSRVVPAALNALRVLVVDDNPMAREVMTGLLAHLPVQCDTAVSGEQALALVQDASLHSQPYGLLLLDWHLGAGLDGLEVASRVRTLAGLRQPRIVLVTAYGRDDAERQEDAAKVDACLSKPVRPSDLIDVLAGLFASDPDELQRLTPTHRHSGAGAGDAEWNLRDLRVLLVEDNPINQQIACELLEIVGIRVATATNGVEALAWLDEHSLEGEEPIVGLAGHTTARQPCDVVLMDLNMPEMDGWVCASRIRSQSRWQEVPILAMTAHAMQQERDRCLSLGMQDHITKPIDPDFLYERLRHWGRREATVAPTIQPVASEDAAMPVGSTPAAGALPQLEGFDMKGALRRVAGNTALYRRLLESLLHTQSDALERLDAALAERNLKEAEHIVHTVKGVAANLGAIGLADAAACLDAELKQGVCPETRRLQFAEQLALTLHRLRHAFAPDSAAGDGEAPRPAPDAPLSHEQRTVLEQLMTYLEASDGEALEMSEVQQPILTTILGSDGYARLARQIQCFEFSAAQSTLRQLVPAERRGLSSRPD